VREVLIKDQELYHVEEFGAFNSTSVCVNWPYTSDCILLSPTGSPGQDGETMLTLNPCFEEHIRNIKNWTQGSRFMRRYPELVHAIQKDTTCESEEVV